MRDASAGLVRGVFAISGRRWWIGRQKLPEKSDTRGVCVGPVVIYLGPLRRLMTERANHWQNALPAPEPVQVDSSDCLSDTSP